MGVADLADYPWDAVAPYAERAAQHPDGIVDLSIGSPVDRDAAGRRRALWPTRPTRTPIRRRSARPPCARRSSTGTRADAACPASRRTTCSRRSARKSSSRCCRSCSASARATSSCIRAPPTRPTRSAPALVGATPVASDDPAEWPEGTRLVWINSPGNPDGRVLDAAQLRVRRGPGARARRCARVRRVLRRAGLGRAVGRRADPVGPRPAGRRAAMLRGILSVYSLSKQSNLAGYRAAFLAGDPDDRRAAC